MSAGLSRRAETRRRYRILRRIAREVGGTYQRGTRSTWGFVTGRSPVGGDPYRVTFNRVNASNGECALFPVIYAHGRRYAHEDARAFLAILRRHYAILQRHEGAQ